MNYLDLLQCCNPDAIPLDAHRCVKAVRHASSNWDLSRLLDLGQLEEYQARQAKDVFADAEFVISFLAERGSRSRFLGVFSNDRRSARVPKWPKEYPYQSMHKGNFWYDLHRVPGYGDLEGRLIVDWGGGTRSWHQWLRPKEVIELLPKGYVRDFPGYLEFTLSFRQLEELVKNPDANRIWHKMLREVAGVYLITDSVSGEQYVGSAYGKSGILGRWSSYTRTGHGGNSRLRVLLKKHPRRSQSFVFSILRTLPRSLTNKEVIKVESQYKEKLGSRAFGLNAN